MKKRFSAFIQGSSDIEAYLRGRGIDTLLIGGTATQVCCESSARDAMMLNFKVVMVPDALATYSDDGPERLPARPSIPTSATCRPPTRRSPRSSAALGQAAA